MSEYYTQQGADDEDGEPPTSKDSPHSGHPNVAGFVAYGRAVSNRLLPIGYTW